MAEAVKNATCKCKHKDRKYSLHTGCLGESKHYRGIPALLKSVRKSPLTSKASTLPKTFTWPAQLLGFTGNVEGWNKFLGLGKR